MKQAGAPPAALRLTVLRVPFAICRLPHHAVVPASAWDAGFLSVTHTQDELSVVAPAAVVESIVGPWRAGGAMAAATPAAIVEEGFTCLRVEGPLDFGLVGILALLTGALAQAQVPVFALSTFNTDYLLVREPHLELAIAALEKAGCSVIPEA